MRIRSRLLSLLLLTVASAAALALSACGGGNSGGGSSGDAKSLLSQAFKKPISKATLDLEIGAKIDGVAALSQPISLKLSGPYESLGKNKVPKLDFDIGVSGGGQAFTGKLISTGDNAYVGFQGQNYEVGQARVKQFEQQLATSTGQQGARSLKALGIDPSTWITDATTAGDQDVAGTSTTKITGGVDVEKLLNDLNSVVDKAGGAMGRTAPSKLTKQQIAQVKQVIKDPKFEIFVAKSDKTLRRMTFKLDFTIPEKQRAQAQGATGGSVTFSLQFSNVGQPAQATAPTGAKPIAELQQQLQGLLGGSSSSGGSSGSSSGAGSGSGSGGSSSPSSQAFQKYADCISKAGGDQAKVAQCATLLK